MDWGGRAGVSCGIFKGLRLRRTYKFCLHSFYRTQFHSPPSNAHKVGKGHLPVHLPVYPRNGSHVKNLWHCLYHSP